MQVQNKWMSRLSIRSCSSVLLPSTTHESAISFQFIRNRESHTPAWVCERVKNLQEPHKKPFGQFLSIKSPLVKLSKAFWDEPICVNPQWRLLRWNKANQWSRSHCLWGHIHIPSQHHISFHESAIAKHPITCVCFNKAFIYMSALAKHHLTSAPSKHHMT